MRLLIFYPLIMLANMLFGQLPLKFFPKQAALIRQYQVIDSVNQAHAYWKNSQTPRSNEAIFRDWKMDSLGQNYGRWNYEFHLIVEKKVLEGATIQDIVTKIGKPNRKVYNKEEGTVDWMYHYDDLYENPKPCAFVFVIDINSGIVILMDDTCKDRLRCE